MTQHKGTNLPKQRRMNYPAKSNRMYLHTTAKWTLLGLAYIYTVKLIDTVYHGIFKPAPVTYTVVGLNILSGAVQLAFFMVFYRQFVPEDKPALRIAAWLAIVGSAVGLLPKVLAMSFLLQLESLFFFLRHSNQISAFSPLVAAVLLLTFSLVFLADRGLTNDKELKMAFVAGAAGWLCMAGAQSLVVVNYLTAGKPVWLVNLFAAGPNVVLIASSLTFLGLAIFYVHFARRNHPFFGYDLSG